MIRFVCVEPFFWKGEIIRPDEKRVATDEEFAVLQSAGNVVFLDRVDKEEPENMMIKTEKRVEKMSKRVK